MGMKNLIVHIVLGVWLAGNVGAQTPTFSFMLYASDSQGNKDSVEIGYDVGATFGIDAQWNETDITAQPFDDQLDIRATLFSNIGQMHSKRHITQWHCGFSGQFFSVGLAIHNANPPLTLTWDQSLFTDSNSACHDFTVLVEDPSFFKFPQATFAPTFLKNGSARFYTGNYGTQLYQAQDSSGQSVTIRGLFLGFAQEGFNVVSNDPKVALPTFVYTPQAWHITDLDPLAWDRWTLYNMHGQQVWQTTDQRSIHVLEHTYLPLGVYFLRGETQAGTVIAKKLIKR